MKITNVRVYGLNESIAASRYPMTINEIDMDCEVALNEAVELQFPVAKKLGAAKSGSGHDCYLKGIIVQFDIQMSQLLYPQISRYHFIDFVSSMSKMHRITKMDLENSFHPSVDDVIKSRFIDLVNLYNAASDETEKSIKAELLEKIYYSIPMGLELTARMTTNYLQLKNIYFQRKYHRLKEWREICYWIESLPRFRELVLGEDVSLYA